ncbi:hypothetical protein [Arthrobacter agilis]|uniref:hypothetical protein n=1 Tax=Arthrobacter agilis TaxID=37921 RepID=UPI002785A2D7|nr:hypothetical protein [Arthrobacter agilis]MDQ0734768.1 hypothetical protein [Arthrobacter agilis]
MHGEQDHGDPGANSQSEPGDALHRETGDDAGARKNRDGNGANASVGTTNSNSTRNTRRSAEQRLLTTRAIHEAELTIADVWLRYFSFSGAVAEYEVHAYLQGLINLPRLQRDLLAQAVNELIDEQPDPRRAPSDADFDDLPGDDLDD